MDPMVSARVPEDLRTRVNLRLKDIGSTPTELINKAYEFVDVTGGLPSSGTVPRAGKRRLSHEQKQALVSAIEQETCAVPESFFAGRDYDTILEAELRRSYEALL